MNEQNKSNYYAIIPASVRYSKLLNGDEKLLYGEITALSNKHGYCYALNRYFADLYGVSLKTISRRLSNLQDAGFIKMQVKRNDKQEVIARYIYIVDAPSSQHCLDPSPQLCPEAMDNSVIYNNINYNKDDLFYFTLDRSSKIPTDFYRVLEDLELLYTNKLLSFMQQDKIEMLKDIIFVLYELYNSSFVSLLDVVKREVLLNLYTLSKEHLPDDLLNYYKRAIINKYTNNST